MGLVVLTAIIGGAFLFIGGYAMAAKDSLMRTLGVLTVIIGVIFSVCSIGIMYEYAQPTVPTEISSLKDQTLRVLGRVQVNNPCGKYAIIAQKKSGELVAFCTSQNVPDVFNVTRDVKYPYVPNAPDGDLDEVPSDSPS